jgi:hypothetical protein
MASENKCIETMVHVDMSAINTCSDVIVYKPFSFIHYEGTFKESLKDSSTPYIFVFAVNWNWILMSSEYQRTPLMFSI